MRHLSHGLGGCPLCLTTVSCCEVVNPLRGGFGVVSDRFEDIKVLQLMSKSPITSRRRLVRGIDGCVYDGEHRLLARHRQLVHFEKRKLCL